MFSHSATIFTRGCRYLLRAPLYHHQHLQLRKSQSPFSLSARSFAAVDAAMADSSSGITAESLRGKIIEQLQAQHVEIEDLSGMYYDFWTWG